MDATLVTKDNTQKVFLSIPFDNKIPLHRGYMYIVFCVAVTKLYQPDRSGYLHGFENK